MFSLQTSRMPQKCCVPNCHGNYHKTKEHAEKVSVFRFTSDPELCTKWVRMTPREGLEVCDKTVMCEKHFVLEFIIRVDTATRADGSIVTVPRKNPSWQLMHTHVCSGTIHPTCLLSLQRKESRQLRGLLNSPHAIMKSFRSGCNRTRFLHMTSCC